jgi:hypothetical protein
MMCHRFFHLAWLLAYLCKDAATAMLQLEVGSTLFTGHEGP